MEIKEAIKAIKSNKPTSGYTVLCEALDIAVSALEKQILKRPKIKSFPKINGFELRCPNGDRGAVLQSDSPCCRYCGQALDWSDVE